MELVGVDRRGHIRGAMFTQRRRYPRVIVHADVYYESDCRALFCERAELSLRGLFVPCRAYDREGMRGVARIDAGPGALVKCQVEVMRSTDPGRAGMALRYLGVGDEAIERIGRMLVRVGGLHALPQLGRRFELVTQLPRQYARLAA
jgi:PilZ domain-containing protein